jgi:hypothetical protein
VRARLADSALSAVGDYRSSAREADRLVNERLDTFDPRRGAS